MIQVGRVGFDRCSQWDQGSGAVTFSTVQQFAAWAEATAALASWEALTETTAPVPVWWDEVPEMAGFYAPSSPQVQRQSLLVYTFSCTLTPVRSSSAPLCESRLLGALRLASDGSANGPGVGSGDVVYWHGVPDAARGYGAPSGASVVTREAASGRVRLYTDVGADATLSWLQDPGSFFDGASAIRVGAGGDLPGATSYSYSGAAQTLTVSEGVTKWRVTLAGAAGGPGVGGAVVNFEMDVTASDTYTLKVGQRGQTGDGVTAWPNGGKGYTGGKGVGTSGGGSTSLETTDTTPVVVAVAGAGGGSSFYGGGAGGYNGQAAQVNANGGAGGGTQSAGGAADPSDTGAAAGASLAGGDGGNPSLLYGAGGGGGGWYGGGGGAFADGGGGGSSMVDGDLAGLDTYTTGANGGDGYAVVSEVKSSTPLVMDRYLVAGRQILNSPFGWEVSNGLVRARPGYDGTTASVEVACWDGADWRPWIWQVHNTAGVAALRARTVSVVRNSPEECRLKVIYDQADELNTVVLYVGLRRGSRLVELRVECTDSQKWGWLLATADTGTTSLTGCVVAAADDDDGNRWVIASPDAWTANTTSGGLALTAAGTKLTVGIGATPDYSSAQDEDLPQALTYQFFSAGSESMAVVSQ